MFKIKEELAVRLKYPTYKRGSGNYFNLKIITEEFNMLSKLELPLPARMMRNNYQGEDLKTWSPR